MENSDGAEFRTPNSEFRISTEYPMSGADPHPRLTDSPWFWLMVFSATAMTAATVIGPKYAVRMARKERMMNANETIAAAREAGVRAKDVEHDRPPVVPYTEEDYLRSPELGWIVGLLSALMLAGAAGMHYSRYRRRASGAAV
jgi:hypothetical protein